MLSYISNRNGPELEAHKAREEAELDSFIKGSYAPPWKLPTMKEVKALVSNLDAHLNADPELGRAMLRRWLNDSFIKLDKTDDGEVIALIDFFPMPIVIDGRIRKEVIPPAGSDWRDNPLFYWVAGAGFASVSIEFRCVLRHAP
jgi:hypothetical protein